MSEPSSGEAQAARKALAADIDHWNPIVESEIGPFCILPATAPAEVVTRAKAALETLAIPYKEPANPHERMWGTEAGIMQVSPEGGAAAKFAMAMVAGEQAIKEEKAGGKALLAGASWDIMPTTAENFPILPSNTPPEDVERYRAALDTLNIKYEFNPPEKRRPGTVYDFALRIKTREIGPFIQVLSEAPAELQSKETAGLLSLMRSLGRGEPNRGGV